MADQPAVIAPASPLPWTVEVFGATVRVVSGVDPVSKFGDDVTRLGAVQDAKNPADARYIVHCANLYPELIAALKSCVDGCERLCIGNVDLVRAVLAKCEGRP